MYKGKTILGIIPARGGSKGLPGKNIMQLIDKPLIAWTIEQAGKSMYMDKVIVNTDDIQIAETSKRYGAEIPFMRPPELAGDSSKIIDAVFHALDTLAKDGKAYDYLALLEPTSPLRKNDDIDNAIMKLIDAGDSAESLISVGEIALEHPIYAKKVTKDGYVKTYFDVQKTDALRQDIPAAFFPYGVIYLSKVSAVRKHKAVYPERIIPYFIERWQNYEINDKLDFMCVETILKLKKEESK